MKIRKYIIGALAMAGTCMAVSCSDSFMQDLNTDPTKSLTIDANGQLTTAELQLYGDLGLQETYRAYHVAFNQHFMGCWNTTNYGGQHRKDDEQMRRIWTQLYTKSVRELTDAIEKTNGKEDKRNINAAVRIMRVYVMSLLTDTYGDVPYFEAGKVATDSKILPAYDQQKDIYYDFFKELKEAGEQIGHGSDALSGDLMLDGKTDYWSAFANSLRLRFAMRISKVDPEKAKAEFEDALKSVGGVMTEYYQCALVKHMSVAFSFGNDADNDFRTNAFSELCFGNDPQSNPTFMCSTLFNELRTKNDPRLWYICGFYYDKLLGSDLSTRNRVDLTEEVLASATPQPCQPGEFWYAPWPNGYWSNILDNLKKTLYPDIEPYVASECRPKLNNLFLQGNNPGVVMTNAEVWFLLAEATLMGWNTGTTDAEYDKRGVKAAMQLMVDHYGARISNAEIEAYLAGAGAYNEAAPLEVKLRAINTQAWILHMTNPAEAWANIRRSGYPELKSPINYIAKKDVIDGETIPVRLCYPLEEKEYNTKAYTEALSRMGGTDSWNTHVWWDRDSE